MPSNTKKRSRAQSRFGAHMSIAGGLHCAFQNGKEVGCDCMQVFVKNQRQWSAAPYTENDIQQWQNAQAEIKIAPVVAHAAYLINLAAPDDSIWQKSIDAYTDELQRCEQLGILWLVIHPGSHRDKGLEWGIQRIATALKTIHQQTAGYKVKTTLETTAGQGSSIGHRFEQLAEIIDHVQDPERMAVCFDTCHVFAAGYDITTEKGYTATMSEFKKIIGRQRLACFHLNDSKKPLASRVDRHELIGKGEMGIEPFRLLVNDERYLKIPMILETPKGTGDDGRNLDLVNLQSLRDLCVSEVSS